MTREGKSGEEEKGREGKGMEATSTDLTRKKREVDTAARMSSDYSALWSESDTSYEAALLSVLDEGPDTSLRYSLTVREVLDYTVHCSM
jgi:hypothetical protein